MQLRADSRTRREELGQFRSTGGTVPVIEDDFASEVSGPTVPRPFGAERIAEIARRRNVDQHVI